MTVVSRKQGLGISLAWLVIAAIVPIIAFSAWVAWLLLDRQTVAVEAELASTSRALMVAVDRELASELMAMEVIATDHSLDHNDLIDFSERARRVMAKHPAWLDIVLVDPHSHLIVDGALGRPDPAPTSSSPANVDKVVATGKPVIVGAFAKGKIIDRPMILLMAPVIRNGEVRYVMAVVLDQMVVSSIFGEQHLPQSWTASAIDGDLRIAGRSRNPEQYVGRPATPMLSKRIAAAEVGMFQGTVQEGDRVYTVFNRSPLTGWTVAMGIPADEVEGPIRRTVTEVLAAGAALAALALALAGFISRTIIVRRKAYEDAQQESAHRLAREADRYQFLLKTASDGIHVLDNKGNLIEASDSFLHMLGYAQEQASRLNVRDWDALHPPEAFDTRLADHLARPSIFETKHRRADGSVIDVEVLCHGVKFEGREYIYGSSRDITERKRLEETLRHQQIELAASELRYHSLFSRAKVVELIIDPVDGAIVDANAAAAEFYGYDIERLKGMCIWDINVLSADEIAREMADARAEKRDHFNFRHRIASGEVRDVEVHSGPLEIAGRNLLLSVVHDATDRRRLELERQRLEMAIEQSPASVVITNLEGTIEYVNSAFTRITGYSREEAIGQNPRILKSNETPDAQYVDMWAALTSGKSWAATFRNKCKDGSLYWENALISPIIGADGQITHYLGVKENITDRRAAEQAIRDLSRQLQDVLAAASEVAIIATDRVGTITLFNRGAERMLGYDAAEVIGIMTPAAFHLREEMDARSAELEAEFGRRIIDFDIFVAKAEAEASELGEWTYRRKDGTTLNVSVAVTPVRSDDGEIGGYLGVATDITERKLAEAAVIQERNFIQSAIDSLPGIFYLINDRGGFDLWNRSLETVTGYRTEEIAGMPVAALFDGSDRETIAAKTAQVFTDGQADAEASLVSKNGERTPYYFSGRRLASDDGVRLVGMGIDISERKRAEDLLREKEFILSESQRIGHVGTWHYVLGGKLTWSDETYRISRVSSDTFTPSVDSLISLIHPDDKAAMGGWMEACAAGQQPPALDIRIHAPDGTEYILSGYGELQRDAEDKPSHMIGIVHDITERKLAEVRLRESEERFRSLVEGTTDWVWETDSDHRFTWFSPSFELVSGASSEAALGKHRWDLASRDRDIDPVLWQAHMVTLGEHQPFRDFRYWLHGGDGQAKWISISGSPRFSDDGRFLGYRGSGSDITAEARRASTILRQRSDQFKQPTSPSFQAG